MGDVLALATSGIKKTHIMYRANLSYEQVHLYLGELIGKRLIAQDVSQMESYIGLQKRVENFCSTTHAWWSSLKKKQQNKSRKLS